MRQIIKLSAQKSREGGMLEFVIFDGYFVIFEPIGIWRAVSSRPCLFLPHKIRVKIQIRIRS